MGEKLAPPYLWPRHPGGPERGRAGCHAVVLGRPPPLSWQTGVVGSYRAGLLPVEIMQASRQPPTAEKEVEVVGNRRGRCGRPADGDEERSPGETTERGSTSKKEMQHADVLEDLCPCA